MCRSIDLNGTDPIMEKMLRGRVALVTGGARGLGRAIAGVLADAGASGMVLDVGFEESTLQLPEGWIAVTGDVRRIEDIEVAVAKIGSRFGRLDVVVANAGLVPPWSETEALDLAEWDNVFAVNVRGVAATIKASVPLMKETGGAIVVLGSMNSQRAHPRMCLYTATKHAVLGIVRATALDLGRYGIRVNAVGPGPILTDALRDRIARRAAEGGPTLPEAIKRHADETALGRMATETNVANTVLFLASNLSAAQTGVIIPVDSGLG